MSNIARDIAPRTDAEYIVDLLSEARIERASDLHVTAGQVPWMRVDGAVRSLNNRPIVDAKCITAFIAGLSFSEDQRARFYGPAGHTEARYEDEETGPIRLQGYRSHQGDCIAMRLLSDVVPKLSSLGLPEICSTFPKIRNGLVLFTGETGSGKSTALASVIDRIMDEDAMNIITFEDPIEYIHKSNQPDGLPRQSRISQINIGIHAENYEDCLHSALRADPDFMMVGEMRDAKTIENTIVAAQTGHVVFSTGHDQRATKTVSRLVNAFPPEQQSAVCYSLANVLRAVVSLRLLPHSSGKGRVSCGEVLVVNDSVKSLIEENKVGQLANAVSMGSGSGMQTLEGAIAKLVAEGKIASEVAKGEIEIERHDQLKQMFERYKVRW